MRRWVEGVLKRIRSLRAGGVFAMVVNGFGRGCGDRRGEGRRSRWLEEEFGG